MKKRWMSLALVLALCLSLAVPALAAGETVLTDEFGNEYHLSNPVIASGTETFWKGTEVVYQVPDGTVITIQWADPASHQQTIEEIGLDLLSVETYQAVGSGVNGKTSVTWYEEAEWHEILIENLWFRPVKAAGGETPSETGFSDVKPDDWFAEPVKWAVEKGITDGTGGGKFSPERTCSQAQILTFLWRAYGSPESTTTPASVEYLGLDESAYYYKAALWAVEKSLITGYFDFDAPCRRQDVVMYLWTLADYPSVRDNMPFTDVPAGMALYAAVSWAVTEGITTGSGGGKFSPDKTCTRGEIVTFLYRAVGK